MKELEDKNIDNRIRELMSGTKVKAGDNLKYRIMQQIETEASLSKKKARSSFSVLNSLISIFGTMYAIIAVVCAGVYFSQGKNGLESSSFFMTIVLITSAFSMYWLISMYDEKRRVKNKREKE